MKILYYALATLLVIGCGSAQVSQTSATETNESSKSTKSNSSFTDAERIGEMMNYLASNDMKGREAGSEAGSKGIEMAATYIENYFKSYGLKPYFETYRDTLSNFKKPSYNIVGVVEGNDPELKDEFILIGAHYDHIGTIKPENGDSIANGANDNASGTTSVLEMARYFGTQKTNKRSLIFALFSAEEKGLLGSKHLAKKLKEEDLNLYTMLNFEMTGVPLKGKDYFMYITGYDMSNLAAVSNKYAEEELVGFLPTAKEFNLYQRSDNYPFHEEFGVPSHTFCTFDFTNFNHYHKVGDENSLMDFDHMATLVNKTIPEIEGIASAPSQEIKLN